MTTFRRYVAIGDSSTEGLEDPDGAGGYIGWADRLAQHIADVQDEPLEYANLAIRGLRTHDIRVGQLNDALAMRPDLLTRMHAATKPQVLGLMLMLTGLGLVLRDPTVCLFLLLVLLAQMATAPVAGHMVGRASYRAGQVDRDLLVVDELSDQLPVDRG